MYKLDLFELAKSGTHFLDCFKTFGFISAITVTKFHLAFCLNVECSIHDYGFKKTNR